MDVLDLKTINDRKWNQRIHDEARIANDLQRDNPDLTRTEALKLAKAVMDSVESRK